MQIVNNKTFRPLIIPVPTESQTNVPGHEAVRLMPGTNEVTKETVAALERSATARHWKEKNWIEISEPKEVVREDGEAEGLEGFEASAAIVFVNECMDLSTLERWSEVEKRKDVKAALKKRQKELEKVINHETRGAQE